VRESPEVLPIVLVHGGGFDGRCWDRLVPLLAGPSLAVDLPGRGAHPTPLGEVTLAACADTVCADVDAAGFDELVLVGHSLAGCSMPGIVGRLGARVRHVVFVACTVPADGHSAFDVLDADIQALIRDAGEAATGPMPPDVAAMVLGDDLTEEQFAWCSRIMVGEAPALTTEPVDLAPLRRPRPRTWVRTLRDLIVPPDRQALYACHAGVDDIVDVAAGHMCMVTIPDVLAGVVNAVASAPDER
jgi:pimeloyl-ACP methyl ester carboxylesterase